MRRLISLCLMAALAGFVTTPANADLRLGWQTGVVNAILTYAVETGKFKEQNLVVELKPFAAGPAMLPAFASGEIDFGWMGEFPAVTGFANGLPIEIVLVQSMLPTDVRLVANPASKIETLKDLRGKKIGFTLGSTSHHHVLLALTAVGLTASDVTLVNLAPANMASAYAAGQVDAVFTWEPGSGEIEKQGGKTIASTRSLNSNTGLFGVARKSYIEKNGAEFQKFIKAWSISLADYKRDPKLVLSYEAKRLNQSVEQLQALIERQGAVFPAPNEQLSADLLGTSGANSQLLKHAGNIGAFLLEQKRIKALPPSFEPLINRGPLDVHVKENKS